MTIKIIVADSHPFFINGVCETLTGHTQCQIVGQTTNHDDLVELITDLRPDILIMGVNWDQFFDINKLLFLQNLKIPFNVIILSAIEEPNLVMDLIRMGIKGFVTKDEKPEKLLEAVEAVYKGKSWFSPQIMKIVTDSINQKDSQSLPDLNDREIEILLYWQLNNGLIDIDCNKTTCYCFI
ncbi:MAG: hypothetical protein CVU41_11780 [Chloroflexi bacterium HGW-Chloroflexi-3]|nr:MAG: hypothetical protein CVU41_11780 [Chloroflexi bacterium HGW-Chloroflexi-3]